MNALGWVKDQVIRFIAPSYSAHLEAQREKVARYKLLIQHSRTLQEKFSNFLNRCKQPITRFGIHALVKRYVEKILPIFPDIKQV